MNLYRLDHVATDGSVMYPVTDIAGTFLTKSAQAARTRALAEVNGADGSNGTGGVVRCTRIQGGGSMKVMWHASGETKRIHRADN